MKNHDSSDKPPEGRENGKPPAPVQAPETKLAPLPVAVVVDRVSHEDIPEICGLYKRVWESERAGLPPEFLKTAIPTPLEFTSRMEGITFFVARAGRKLLGAVGCAFEDGSCRLIDLAVDQEVRRQGVGTALVTAAVDHAKRNRANLVWVPALTRFEAASGLLKRLGFVEVGLLHRQYHGLDVRYLERTL